ncbi:hypothetical protein CGZ93_01465 [Enemella dayhoffiae]|uniref:Uridine kinase n=1 Tax=Enemella dayhoffiae TaxID=2016507 RepID=A0A255HCD4_9ACTN|nr:hypothetical protein CGZ93_01465 [Enemella dayhoffiae]
MVAVDGRGAAGKSTLAEFVVARTEGSVVVHTDDIAWHEGFFTWGGLLRDGVLAPASRGESVAFTPPAWGEHGRAGAIEIPVGTALVVVEGTGAAQRAVADLVDVVVWVQSDFAEAERRGIARDLTARVNGDAEQTVAFWHEWMGHELAFFARDRPWDRADLIVAGTHVIDLLPGEFAIGRGAVRRRPALR